VFSVLELELSLLACRQDQAWLPVPQLCLWQPLVSGPLPKAALQKVLERLPADWRWLGLAQELEAAGEAQASAILLRQKRLWRLF
jgi:hypothetical protein